MSEPTLFDQLREVDAAGRRFGTNSDRTFVPYDAGTLRLWEQHGIPADLSTLEQACELLMALWRHHQALKASVDQYLATGDEVAR